MKQRLKQLQTNWRNKTKGQQVVYVIIFLLVPVVLIPLVIWLVKKIKDMLNTSQDGKTPKPKGTAEKTLIKLVPVYGLDFMKRIEQALRLETAHFTSGQWLKTGTAGMEASPRDNSQFPYGWKSLIDFNKKHGYSEKDYFIRTMKDNHTGDVTNYIGFKETGVFVEFMSHFLFTVRKGNVEAWNRLTKDGQAEYGRRLDKIVPKFLNKSHGK